MRSKWCAYKLKYWILFDYIWRLKEKRKKEEKQLKYDSVHAWVSIAMNHVFHFSFILSLHFDFNHMTQQRVKRSFFAFLYFSISINVKQTKLFHNKLHYNIAGCGGRFSTNKPQKKNTFFHLFIRNAFIEEKNNRKKRSIESDNKNDSCWLLINVSFEKRREGKKTQKNMCLAIVDHDNSHKELHRFCRP